MKKQFLAVQVFVMSLALNASAGGVGSTEICQHVDKVLVSAPLQVYLPDGHTKKTVGEASLVSRKAICESGAFEVIDIDFNLDDEIQPYGLKIKDTIIGFESKASIEFRIKELVNSTENFHPSPHGQTKINHFGSVGTLELKLDKQDILFWINAKSGLDSLITANANTPSSNDRPLACSIERGSVTLTKKADDKNGLAKDLTLMAFFQGPLQLCP